MNYIEFRLWRWNVRLGICHLSQPRAWSIASGWAEQGLFCDAWPVFFDVWRVS